MITILIVALVLNAVFLFRRLSPLQEGIFSVGKEWSVWCIIQGFGDWNQVALGSVVGLHHDGSLHFDPLICQNVACRLAETNA